MTVSNRFQFRSTGNQWKGQLVNCTDPENPVPVDLTGFNEVYIVFTKPDGTQFPTDDQMVEGFDQGAFIENPSAPDDTFIVFDNEETPSILDIRGLWEFVPAAKIGDTIIKSPVKTIFWVT